MGVHDSVSSWYRVPPEPTGDQRDPIWWVFPVGAGCVLFLLLLWDLFWVGMSSMLTDTCTPDSECLDYVSATAGVAVKVMGVSVVLWLLSWLVPLRRSARGWRVVAAVLVVVVGVLPFVIVLARADGVEQTDHGSPAAVQAPARSGFETHSLEFG